MKDYVLNKKPEPAANETVWAFDLGILSASNDVPRSRERERVVADRVRDVGEKHSSAAGPR